MLSESGNHTAISSGCLSLYLITASDRKRGRAFLKRRTAYVMTAVVSTQLGSLSFS